MTHGLNPEWGALFDLDGVLIDSEDSYSVFWHDIDKRYPTGVTDFEYVIKGSTLEKILETYFSPTVREEILSSLKEHELTMEYRFFDGVENFLEILKTNGIPCAIVTSSNSVKMHHLFEQLPSLRQVIDVVITGDDVTNSKPDPEGYKLAAKRLGLPSSQCVVFEDSLAGIEAGRRAGGAVVGVATTRRADELRDLADLVVNLVSEVDINAIPGLLAKVSCI